jgi:hypothetical protein
LLNKGQRSSSGSAKEGERLRPFFHYAKGVMKKEAGRNEKRSPKKRVTLLLCLHSCFAAPLVAAKQLLFALGSKKE